jgi:hypothetical protein
MLKPLSRGLRRSFSAALVLAAMTVPAVAADLPKPQGPVVLTVHGAIENTTDGSDALFDRDLLEALPVSSFRTSTIWTEKEIEFTGVALNDLLAYVRAKGSVLRATALNDYRVDIPVSDAVQGGPIVAYRTDGTYMSARDKGPLWIVYPYNSNPDHQSEVIYSRSIWQLDEIEVVE